VTGKRPFNLRSNQQATLQEVQDLFRPQGTLWTSLQSRLGTAVQRQGPNWVNVGSAPQSQSFLSFLNRAQQFADTLFPNGSPSMHLGYSLLRLPTGGIDQADLVIDGQSLTDVGRPHQFTWQGGESSVSLNVTAAGQKLNGPSAQGPWALFEFFNTADTCPGRCSSFLILRIHGAATILRRWPGSSGFNLAAAQSKVQKPRFSTNSPPRVRRSSEKSSWQDCTARLVKQNGLPFFSKQTAYLFNRDSMPPLGAEAMRF